MADYEPTRGDLIYMGRVAAASNMLGRAGATELEYGYLDDDAENPRWWAKAIHQGRRMYAENCPYPHQAIEQVLERFVNGGRCVHCGRTTVLGMAVPDLCAILLTAADVDDPDTYRYEQQCDARQAQEGE